MAVYSTHASWAIGASSAIATPALSVAFLGLDFLLFASASLIHPDIRLRSLVALALLNWLGALSLASYSLRDPHTTGCSGSSVASRSRTSRSPR